MTDVLPALAVYANCARKGHQRPVRQRQDHVAQVSNIPCFRCPLCPGCASLISLSPPRTRLSRRARSLIVRKSDVLSGARNPLLDLPPPLRDAIYDAVVLVEPAMVVGALQHDVVQMAVPGLACVRRLLHQEYRPFSDAEAPKYATKVVVQLHNFQAR